MKILLQLGRVSNLPTVWTNVLAGAVLGGGTLSPLRLVPTAIAMSFFYIGGMYLNDAFDADIDARERPERPIPSGRISAKAVFRIGFGLLGLGELILLVTTWSSQVLMTGLALAAAIVVYDAWHKKNPFSPFLMGVCRMLVYLNAAVATGGELSKAGPGALVLLGYLIGLTYVAKQENLDEVKNFWPLAFLAAPLAYAPVRGLLAPVVGVLIVLLIAWIARAIQLLRVRAKGNIPRAVASLIAGIALVDAILAAAHGSLAIAAACALLLPATLLLHRWVAGT